MFFNCCGIIEKISSFFFLHRVFWTNFAETWFPGLRIHFKLILSPEKILIYNSRNCENSTFQGGLAMGTLKLSVPGDTSFVSPLESFVHIQKTWRRGPAAFHVQGGSFGGGEGALSPLQLPLSALRAEITHFPLHTLLMTHTDFKSLCIEHLSWLLFCWSKINSWVWGTMWSLFEVND